MKRYAPEKMELAPRDVVSRSIQTEINEGRGIGGKDYVYLDIRHLGKEKILSRIPQIYELARDYLGVDCTKDPVPIQPTAHYSMGGIPTDVNCQVVIGEKKKPITGFYAAGECACSSVHGANRLGTNSLLEAIVYGRRAGRSIKEWCRSAKLEKVTPDEVKRGEEPFKRLFEGECKGNIADIKRELQETMTLKCGVFRNENFLRECHEKIKELQKKYYDIRVRDKGSVFNTDFIDVIETGNLLNFAEAIVLGALERKESRGAHSRTDFPKRDDKNWLKHTLAFRKDGRIVFEYKPVVIKKYQPQERKY